MAVVRPAEPSTEGRRRYDLANPATLESLGSFECASDDDVSAMVERAHDAQPGWEALGPAARATYLKRALAYLVSHQDDLVDVIVGESGKPRTEAFMIDVFAAADALAYNAKHAQRWLKPESGRPHGVLRFTKKLQLHYRALGVVAVISPWNGPLILSLNPAIQALLAGNTVVLKPSEVTPFSGKLAVDIFARSGSAGRRLPSCPG